MPARIAWGSNGRGGWYTTTVRIGARPVFIVVMRKDPSTWRWIGYANGHPLGEFNGLTLAKQQAPGRAKELLS